ncbi:protein eyes shut-like isoform X2 [Eriocheir sinensis]|uniref:protein eyes shut-like isoform X2 n=1 Tax=Eriocheir sinensis TaxID=95602 RepID=UPI0021C83D2D|nr:protein eyes shut-like isoform X2 [Eriocheir sinensis]
MSTAAMVVVVAATVGVAEVEAGVACIRNPCNNGVCVDNLNSSSFHCFCEDGFTGLLCQTNWDDCWSAPCLNGATCTDLVADLACICPPGYTGQFCEAEINECRSNPCQNNGTCQDMLNRYVCSCPTGYSGVNCEIDVSVCNSSSLWTGVSPNCLHGGVCVDGPGLSYTCLCQPGWTGKRCEEDEDECCLMPCQNDAVCINTPGSFACACQFGFTGPLCEEDLVFCKSSPCKNDALCVMEDHNATCYCVPDFHGSQCEKQYNDCLPYAPRCMNGGVCIDGVDSFKCSCPATTSGVLCQCVSTTEGQHCQPLPYWFEDKPFQPNVPLDPKFFGTYFNISYPRNDSFIEDIPSPTLAEDVTSVIDTAEFPRTVVTSDILMSSFITPTVDVFTISSVLSAKVSLVFSEVPVVTVPYFTSLLYESPFPSTSLDPFLTAMQPTPVLPVPTSSPRPEDIDTSYEYPPETGVLLPTLTLEGPLLTPSLEFIPISIISVFGVFETPTTSVLIPADRTIAIPTPEEVASPSVITHTITTVVELTPALVFPPDASPTIITPPLDIAITTSPLVYPTVATPEVLITPSPPTDITTLTVPPDTAISVMPPDTYISPVPTETYITPAETELTATILDTTPTPTPEIKLTSKIEATATPDFEITPTPTPFDDFTPVSPVVDFPVTSPPVDTVTPEVEVTSPPTTEVTLRPDVEVTPVPSINMTLVPPAEPPTTPTVPTVTPTTISLPPGVPSTPSPPPQVTTFPPDGFTTPPPVSRVPCGKSFCLNGGICRTMNGTSLCECPFNYRGASCQLYFYINKPYFDGASYLGLDVGNMSLRTGVQPFHFLLQVYVQFTSQDENGLVAYSEGPGEAFFMLLLRNSLLQFVFSCGLNTVSFLQGNVKLSRNCLTDVSLRMWWTPYLHDTPWGPGKCSASLQVNGTDPVYSEQKAWSPLVQLGLLYLGGLPSTYSSPLVVKAGFLPRLKGCVSLLEVNGREVDIWTSGVSGERIQECGTAPCPPQSCYNGGSCVPGPALWSCQCPKGYQGELCEHAECEGVTGPCHAGRCVPTAHHSLCLCPNHRHGLFCELERVVELPSYSGGVAGYSSYSAYRIEVDITRSLAIRLHFSTPALQQVGLMAYIGNSVRASVQDFLALSLVRGYLMLTWDLGAGPRRIVTPEPLDPTLHTHSALVGRQGRWAWFLVDAQRNVSAKGSGFLSSLNTNNLLYIGGHPSFNMSHLPADMWRLNGFHGCIFDLRVAKSSADPWTAVRVAAALNVQECGQDECRAEENQCLNGGRCVALGATFRCECPLGWKGPKCEVPSHLCEGGAGTCHPGSSCLPAKPLQRDAPKCLCQLGRTGPLCSQAINITDLSFSGEGSYASLQSTRSLRRESHVTLSFKPDHLSGVLFLALPVRSSGDFMALVLVNGTLQFTFSLGLHAPGLVLLQSEATARLGEWQAVTISRVEGSASIIFQGHTTRSPTPAPTHTLVLLDTHSEVFIGGVPDYSAIPAAAAPQEALVPFQGCIRQVTLNGVEHDLRVPEGGLLRGAGLGDCDGTPCGHQVCLHGGTCTPAGDSYACTCTKDYLGQRCQLPRACLNHQCLNGATCVPTDEASGRQKRRQKVAVRPTAPLRAYNSFYEKDDQWLEEVVEDYIRGEKSKTHRDQGRNSSTDGEEHFKKLSLLQNLERSIESDGNISDQSKRKTEENSIRKLLQDKREAKGDDDQGFSNYRCLCPPGYYGLQCQTAGLGGLRDTGTRFSGYSFGVVGGGHYGLPSPHLDSFSFNFTTSASHGLLLWRGQVEAPGKDYLGVGVEGSRVKVVWHLGGGNIGRLLLTGSVSNSQWHSLVVIRHGTVVTAFLDGTPQKASLSGTYTQLNDPQGLVYIGGFPDEIPIKYGSEGHFQRPFTGCMRDLTIHQSSYPIKFSSLIQGQDLQPCS